jgi:SAM-dependent methyltransferase
MRACRALGREDVSHAGVDYCAAETIPEGFDFRKADLNCQPLPFGDDTFDLVVASHVMEHLSDPVRFFGDCLRVVRPSGLLYVSAPSERSLWLPGFPFDHESFYSLSFFDDPTHSHRPFSPQSLIRLAKYYGCTEVESRHTVKWRWRLASPILVPYALIAREGWLLEKCCWNAIGWETVAVARKAERRGPPKFTYFIPEARARGPLMTLARKVKRLGAKSGSAGSSKIEAKNRLV